MRHFLQGRSLLALLQDSDVKIRAVVTMRAVLVTVLECQMVKK